MKINFSFKKSFFHRIYFYLCIGVLLPIFTCAAIELRTTPLKKDRFAIFIAADLKPTSTLSASIHSYLSEYGNKKITVSACDPDNSFFSAHYGSEALLSDIVIMSESAFQLIDFSLYVNIPKENPFYNDTNYITSEGKHIGILFGEGENTPWNNDVYFKNEKYYAFVSGNSVHAEYFYDDYKDDQVISLLRKVLNEEK